MLNANLKSRQRGVSLIELMIGMIIVGILLSIAIPSFSSWINSARIRTTAESIQNGLQVARMEAVRHNALVQITLDSLIGGGTGSDWTVGCVTPTAACPANIQQRSAAEGSNNINISATENTIAFNSLGSVTPVGTPVNNIDVPSDGVCAADAATAGLNKCLRIIVQGGKMLMCDRSVSTTAVPPDPRACI